LHELITGVAPFDGETMPDLLAAILQNPAPTLRQHRPDAPHGLEAIVARCLEKDPAARYADVAELTEALAPFGSAMARVSADRVSRVIRPRPPDTSTSPPITRTTIPSTSKLGRDVPASGTVTVSATADAWGATSAPARSTIRTLGLAVGLMFFAITMLVAIFGGHSQPSAARTRASAEESLVIAPPLAARQPEPTADTADLALPSPSQPVASPPASSSPSSKAPLVAPARLRSVPAVKPAPSAPVATSEPDLFDGRK
jgi:serine/threonine protein kinase